MPGEPVAGQMRRDAPENSVPNEQITVRKRKTRILLNQERGAEHDTMRNLPGHETLGTQDGFHHNMKAVRAHNAALILEEAPMQEELSRSPSLNRSPTEIHF